MCIRDEKKRLKNINCPTKLDIFGHDVQVVSRFKLLGVFLDDELSLEANVENVSSRVYSCLFSLKSKFFLSKDTKLQFFETIILHIFDYCISKCCQLTLKSTFYQLTLFLQINFVFIVDF